MKKIEDNEKIKIVKSCLEAKRFSYDSLEEATISAKKIEQIIEGLLIEKMESI